MKSLSLARFAVIVCSFGAVGVSVGACTAITNFDKYSSGRASADAAADGASEGKLDAGSDASVCSILRPPATLAGAPTDGATRLTFAVSSWRFPELDANGAILGYDLDSLCSGKPDRFSCINKGAAADPSVPASIDAARGVDNAGARFFKDMTDLVARLGSDAAIAELSPNLPMERGLATSLIVVTGYNGQPNDANVQVGMLPGLAVESSTSMTRVDGRLKPDFDGNDRWSCDKARVKPGVLPPEVVSPDAQAYVVGGILVARFGSSVRVGNLTLALEDAYFTARIVQNSGKYTLEEGVFAGRLDAGRVLTSLAALTDPNPLSATKGQPLCKGNPWYELRRKFACNTLDVTADSNNSGSQPCDALSLAMSFRADTVTLGNPIVAPNAAPPCGANYVDDCLR